ncbi:MAG: YbhB/YbcL family Raf kinase inhibitor-like protein [Planctomycetes bacterium]|nr:YbhB/YbcL family Raf kinase inhibitor-like protein [Planctomycetota bacterium]
MSLEVKSSAFTAGQTIPKKYTADGPDVSPPLEWGEPPAGTKSLALICDDPDAPVGTWVHWVLWGLAADTRVLGENVPKEESLSNGVKQGRNDFKRIGYGGPAPPRGPAHRYFFKVYALDNVPDLKSGATKAELERAMKGHILDQGELMGMYGR